LSDKALAELNRLMTELMYDVSPAKMKFPEGLRYRYFGRMELYTGIWAFCWSVTRNENGKFVSWVYQPIVGKKSWKAVKFLEHRKMKDAKARALNRYKQHQPIQEKYEALLRQRRRKRKR